MHAGFAEEQCNGLPCGNNGAWLSARGFTNAATPAWWWTSTTSAQGTWGAWAVGGWAGHIIVVNKTSPSPVPYVWPVRGP